MQFGRVVSSCGVCIAVDRREGGGLSITTPNAAHSIPLLVASFEGALGPSYGEVFVMCVSASAGTGGLLTSALALVRTPCENGALHDTFEREQQNDQKCPFG